MSPVNHNNNNNTTKMFIPFKHQILKSPSGSTTTTTRSHSNVTYGNLSHVSWMESQNNGHGLVLDNLIANPNYKIYQNNDDIFVAQTTTTTTTDDTKELFNLYNSISQKKLTVSILKEGYLFDNNNNNNAFKSEFLDKLDAICQFDKISISIVNNDKMDVFDIYLSGCMDNIRISETKIRVIIDSLNPVSYIDYIELDTISKLPLIGGIGFNNFKQIAKQTNCHLYLPNILPRGESEGESEPDTKIYISGLQSQVILTKNMICKIKEHITSPYVKLVPIDHLKKTVLCLMQDTSSNSSNITNIMLSNECFIQLPSLNSNENNVLFQANNLEAIEKAIEEFIQLIGEIYSVECGGLSKSISDDGSNSRLYADICSFSNCVLEEKSIDNGRVLTMTGFKDDIKKAISLLSNYQLGTQAKNKINFVKTTIELNVEEREFIGGKKNGKLLKIMNTSNSIIKIIPYSDFSFYVSVITPDLQSCVIALQMLEAELPMSIKFNIPESFHRQIIGVGGTTIQTIMRRFNVFIKFSNTFVYTNEGGNDTTDQQHQHQHQQQQNGGGASGSGSDYTAIQSFIRKNNVVIKCPAKNGNNIPYAKQELEKAVQTCCNMSYFNTFLKLSRSHWRLLSNNSIGIANGNAISLNDNSSNSNFIIDLEKRTNTFIKFPEFEPISLQLLEIKGVDKNSEQCAMELEKKLPKDYEFKLAYNSVFAEICSIDRNSKQQHNKIGLDFLNSILIPFKLLYNIEVQVFYDPKVENDEDDLFGITQYQGKGYQGHHYKTSSLTSSSGLNFIQNIKNHSPLSPNFEFSSSSSSSHQNNKEVLTPPQFHSIILSFFKEEIDEKDFENCLNLLTSFLRDNKIIIIDKGFNDDKSYIVDGTSVNSTTTTTAAVTREENIALHELNKENIQYYMQSSTNTQPQQQAQTMNPQTYGSIHQQHLPLPQQQQHHHHLPHLPQQQQQQQQYNFGNYFTQDQQLNGKNGGFQPTTTSSINPQAYNNNNIKQQQHFGQ